MHARRLRFYLSASLAACLATVLGAATAGGAAPAVLAAGVCESPVSVVALRADGSTTAAATGDGLGRDYTFPDGFHEVVAPPGFQPQAAAAKALETYLFPPRPTDLSGLNNWQGRFSAYSDSSRDAKLKVCNLGTKNALVNAGASSSNWAGGMVVNNTVNVDTYWDATGTATQPTFVTGASCVNQTGYSMWTGIGGTNQDRLFQAGTEVDPSDANSPGYAFTEALNALGDYQHMWVGAAAQPGDTVSSYVRYDQSHARLTMSVSDNAGFWTVGGYYTAASLGGQDPGAFWDGSTAEWITEAPTNGITNLYYDLRPLAAGPTYPATWHYAVYNGATPVYNAPSWNIHQNGAYTGNVVQGSYFDGQHTWSDPWYRCR